MSIVFKCPICSGEHPSRLIAKRHRSFEEVLPELAEVLEVCPIANVWIPLGFQDLIWKGSPRPALADIG